MSDQPRATARPAVEDVYADDAEGFLRILRPAAAPWCEASDQWIYRGQGDAEWSLKASAVRDPAALGRLGFKPPRDWSERNRVVQEMLDRFRLGLDEGGLTVPVRHFDPKDMTAHVVPLDTPDPRDFPLMALAQHHGLPTLFLDWTRRAMAAAYFAARSALGRDPFPAFLAVWALRARRGPPLAAKVGERPAILRFFQAPGATNPNLRAQAGLFTVLSSETGIGVDEFCAALPGGVRLVRVLLTASEAGEVLRLLAYEGVDGAAMFPGADGVVRAMHERGLWGVSTTEGCAP